jgi:hypothetical protein
MALASFVEDGGLLVMMGDWKGRVESDRLSPPFSTAGYSCDIDGTTAAGRADPRADSASYMLKTVFDWTTQQSTDSISPGVYGTTYSFGRQPSAADVFDNAPTALSGAVTYYSALRMASTVAGSQTDPVAGVPGAKVLYKHGATADNAGVWLAPHGRGNVLYMGWNWRTYTWAAPKDGSHWTEVLQLVRDTPAGLPSLQHPKQCG